MPKKLIACEIGPNYKTKDAFKAVWNLINPFSGSPKNSEFVKNWLAKKHQTAAENTWLTDSGRTALYLLLKTANLPQGGEVIIQAFSCVVVPNGVLQAGLKPVSADIEDQTYNITLQEIQKRKTKKTVAVIVQHSFGLPAEIEKIQKYCEKENLLLIEDCAHGLGSAVDGKWIGSFGDGAIFSFGRDKVISSTIGGAGIINSKKKNQEWKNRMEKEFQKLPSLPLDRLIRSLIYIPLIVFLVKPLYHLQLGKLILLISQKLKIAEPVYTPEESRCTTNTQRPSKFNHRLSNILISQLKNFDEMKNHRLELAKIYAQTFKEEINPEALYLRYQLNLLKFSGQNEKKAQELFEKLYAKLRANGILPGYWYTSYFLPKQANLQLAGVDENDLEITKKVMGKIINLPTNLSTTKKDAEKIAKICKEFLASNHCHSELDSES